MAEERVMQIRLVADPSQVYQTIEQLGKRAGEVTFGSESGRGGASNRGGMPPAVENVVRASERLVTAVDRFTEPAGRGRVEFGLARGSSGFYTTGDPSFVQGAAYGPRTPAPRGGFDFWSQAEESEADRQIAGYVQERRQYRRGPRNRDPYREVPAETEFQRGEGLLAAPTSGPEFAGEQKRARIFAAENRFEEATRSRRRDSDMRTLERQGQAFGSREGQLNEAIAGGPAMEDENYLPEGPPVGKVPWWKYSGDPNGGGGGMSVFYKRFLVMEALRSVGQLAAYRTKTNVALSGAMGDPYAMAQIQTGQELGQGFSSAVPFGIGQIGAGISDFFTGNESAVSSTLSLGRMTEAHTNAMIQSAQFRAQISSQATVAGTTRGVPREIAGFEAARVQQERAIAAEGRERIDKAQDVYRAESEANRQRHATGQRAIGRAALFWLTGGLASTEDTEETAGETAALGRQTGSLRRIAIDTAKSRADNDTAFAVHKTETARDAITQAVGLVAGGLLGANQASRLLMPTADNALSPQFMLAQRTQSRQFGIEQLALQQAQTYQQTVNTNPVLAGPLKLQQQGEMQMAQAQQRAADIQDSEATRRTVAMEQIGAIGRQDVARAYINRDTPGAIRAAAQGQRAQAGEKYRDQPEQLSAELGAIQEEENLRIRDWGDAGLAIGGHQATTLAVTGRLAQAIGPGARDIRRQAGIIGVAGETEERAQTLLRAGRGVGFADRERQIGINRLGAERADYLESLRGMSGNAGLTNFRSPESSSPNTVLSSIESGIRAIQGNVGGSDTSGTEATPNLLRQILNTLLGGITATAQ